MGRGKIEIKKIENANSRQVTFSKRRGGLLKKASELAVLCDAEVAVIIFSNTGKMFDYASTGNMLKLLQRYQKCVAENATSEHKLEQKHEAKAADILKEEIARLKLKQSHLLGKDLDGIGLNELQQLEKEMNEGMQSVRERKEQLIFEQLEQARAKEQRALLESETLRRHIEELRGLRPSTDRPAPLFLEYCPADKAEAPQKNTPKSLDAIFDGDADNGDSDTTLHLGPPSGILNKRKTREIEILDKIVGSLNGKRAHFSTAEKME